MGRADEDAWIEAEWLAMQDWLAVMDGALERGPIAQPDPAPHPKTLIGSGAQARAHPDEQGALDFCDEDCTSAGKLLRNPATQSKLHSCSREDTP
jgi:hypothetical protein